jgi:hypothetical protein
MDVLILPTALSPEDQVLYNRIDSRMKTLTRVVVKTLEGVNVSVPVKYRHALELRYDQPIYHYTTRSTENIRTLWVLCDELTQLYDMASNLQNEEANRSLRGQVLDFKVHVLSLLHMA